MTKLIKIFKSIFHECEWEILFSDKGGCIYECSKCKSRMIIG